MTVLAKAAVTVIAGSVMAVLLKRSAPELGLALSAAISLLAALLAAQLISGLTELIELLREETGLSPAVCAPVIKCVGVGIVTRLSAELCRDAGQGAAASAMELCGAACALTLALPLVRSLLSLITELS